MPTNLNNQANITYSYAESGTGSANSNVTTTTLLTSTAWRQPKSSLTSTFRPGQNLTYLFRLENNGTGPLYTVTVNDDLGAADGTDPLLYVNGSARAIIDNALLYHRADSRSQLTYLCASCAMQPQSVAYIIYMATASDTLGAGVESITNTATVTAAEGSATGPALTVTPDPTTTVTAEAYADVSLYKEASQSTISSGETLVYTFTLTNTGNETAEGSLCAIRCRQGLPLPACSL